MNVKRFWPQLALGAAIILGLAWISVAQAVTPTPTPEPAAKLTYTKTAGDAVDIGGLIEFTISITNSGNLDSNSQTVYDTLPGGVDWWIVEDSWGCELSASNIAGRTLLSCEPAIVERRHLNATEDDFVNGKVSVTVVGQAFQCGPYFNVAVFNRVLPSNPAIAMVRCPATPTPIPSTNTPTPTSTTVVTRVPTTTPVPTLTQPISTPTSAFIPGPPKTGNSEVATGSDWNWIILMGEVLIVLGAGLIFRIGARRE